MIINKTRRQEIIRKTKICRSLLCKGRGLMFTRRADYALVFAFDSEKRRERTLTMMFVFYPIDVLFLDSRMRVVDIKERFMPFTNYTPKKPCRYVIELPQGLSRKTKIGDNIFVSGLQHPEEIKTAEENKHQR
jgi:hypothetical protein